MNVSKASPRWVALLLAAALAAGPVLAQKPEHAGGGKGKEKAEKQASKPAKAERQAAKSERKGDGAGAGSQRADLKVGGYFSDSHRTVVRTYYADHYGGPKGCPPGLAKKNNGCLPPGQAKKYVVGQPLPSGVVYYPVPQPVLVHLPPPPVGHRYVSVAGDILLLAVGTQMVVDALTNLTR